MSKVKFGLALIEIGIGIVAGAGSMYMVCAKWLNQNDTDRDADREATIRNACAIEEAYLKAEYDERELTLKAHYEEREAEILAGHADYRVNAPIDGIKSPVEKKPRVKKVIKQKED